MASVTLRGPLGTRLNEPMSTVCGITGKYAKIVGSVNCRTAHFAEPVDATAVRDGSVGRLSKFDQIEWRIAAPVSKLRWTMRGCPGYDLGLISHELNIAVVCAVSWISLRFE